MVVFDRTWLEAYLGRDSEHFASAIRFAGVFRGTEEVGVVGLVFVHSDFVGLHPITMYHCKNLPSRCARTSSSVLATTACLDRPGNLQPFTLKLDLKVPVEANHSGDIRYEGKH